MRRLVFLMMLVAGASACGKDSPTSPSSRPYSETLSGTVGAFGSTRHALSVPRSGQLTLRLAWSEAVDLDLYLSSSACTALYPKAGCGVVAQSDGVGTNSETIARTVTAGEQFSLWVDNLSFSRAATYTVTMSIP